MNLTPFNDTATISSTLKDLTTISERKDFGHGFISIRNQSGWKISLFVADGEITGLSHDIPFNYAVRAFHIPASDGQPWWNGSPEESETWLHQPSYLPDLAVCGILSVMTQEAETSWEKARRGTKLPEGFWGLQPRNLSSLISTLERETEVFRQWVHKEPALHELGEEVNIDDFVIKKNTDTPLFVAFPNVLTDADRHIISMTSQETPLASYFNPLDLFRPSYVMESLYNLALYHPQITVTYKGNPLPLEPLITIVERMSGTHKEPHAIRPKKKAVAAQKESALPDIEFTHLPSFTHEFTPPEPPNIDVPEPQETPNSYIQQREVVEHLRGEIEETESTLQNMKEELSNAERKLEKLYRDAQEQTIANQEKQVESHQEEIKHIDQQITSIETLTSSSPTPNATLVQELNNLETNLTAVKQSLVEKIQELQESNKQIRITLNSGDPTISDM